MNFSFRCFFFFVPLNASAEKRVFLGGMIAVWIRLAGVFLLTDMQKNDTHLHQGGNYPPPGRCGLQSRALLCRGSSHFVESCQLFFFCFCYYFFQRSQRTVCLMPLFAAGRVELCTVAQIMGGGFSAGGGKRKVTPGWRARRAAHFLSALGLKLQTVEASRAQEAELNA